MSIINQLVEDIKDIVPVVDIRWRDGDTDPPDIVNNKHIFIYHKRLLKFNKGPTFCYYDSYDYEADGYQLCWYVFRGHQIHIEEYWWIPTDFLAKIPLPNRES